MDLPRNRFKHLMSSGARAVGTWLVSGAASTAEAMGCVGFDFLVLDMEHTPVDLAEVTTILRTIEGTPAGVIVRLPWNDMIWVKRVLDAGAQTLMFPFIQNANEATRAVSYTRYPPDGVRGVAAAHRASRHGTVPNYHRNAARELCVIAQIETLAGLEELPKIAAVPGIDSIFIGPGDLSASMGHLGDLAHSDVQTRIAQGAAACREAGKPCGILGPNPDAVAKYLQYGFDWVAIASDISMMVGRAQEWLQKIRE